MNEPLVLPHTRTHARTPLPLYALLTCRVMPPAKNGDN